MTPLRGAAFTWFEFDKLLETDKRRRINFHRRQRMPPNLEMNLQFSTPRQPRRTAAWLNKSNPANRRPAGQLDVSGEFTRDCLQPTACGGR